MKRKEPVRVMDFRGTYKGGGGPDKTILNSASQHDKKRVNVLVVYLRDPEDKEYSIDSWAKSLGIRYVDVPDRKRVDFKCLSLLLKLIDAHDIELIHSHDDKTLLYGWMLKWFRPKVRIMYTCHLHSAYTRKDFDSFRDYLAFMVRTRIQIFLMKQYKKPLLSVSEFTKKTLVSHGLREKDVTVLHNGIDTDQWQKNHGTPVLRNEFDQLKNVLIVGTVARIDQKHKDLPTFYRVAATVSRKWPDVRFVIVGDGHGKLLDETKKMVSDLGLNDIVFFTGHRTDLLNIYSSFDIFLMTSRTEGLPNTVLEAMAMEVPVVSTRVAGVPEIIENGTTGLLCNIGDVFSLSEGVLLFLEKEDERKKMAFNARKIIGDCFNFKKRVTFLEDYYEFLKK